MTSIQGAYEAFEDWEAHLERTERLCRRSPKDGTFNWRGHELTYLDDGYNSTAWNERCIEVPIANAWAAEHEMLDANVLEVGNVMQHYGWSGHRVVDKYEEADGVENIDLFDVTGTFDRILAISTLEHVRDGELNLNPDEESWQAIRHLYQRLRPGGEMLITIPFGQHPILDREILKDDLYAEPTDFGTLVRDPEDATWWYHPDVALWRPARERGWADAVWVATWSR